MQEPAAAAYRPRKPEETILYSVVAEQLETFLARQQERDRGVPGFVEDDFRSFLTCGVLEFGFLRLFCESCKRDRLVAFSCKNRSWCPSCGGRKMADTAAHLVDRVIPDVPVRQWVLSLPFALRYRLAFDAGKIAEVLRIFARAVFGSLKQRARDSGILKGQCGAVTFIQRSGSALNLNVHFHMAVMDGVYASAGEGEAPRFYALRPPEQRDVAKVASRVAQQAADRKSTRLNSSHSAKSRMPSSA